MKTSNLKVKEVLTQKLKDGSERYIIRTEAANTDGPPCKVCHKNPRKVGSGRCVDCSEAYKIEEMSKRKMQERITKSN